MPSRKTSDGEFRDIAHPINQAAREMIQTAVLNEYYNALENESSDEDEQEAASDE